MIIAIVFAIALPFLVWCVWRGHRRAVREWNAWESHEIKAQMYLDRVMQDN